MHLFSPSKKETLYFSTMTLVLSDRDLKSLVKDTARIGSRRVMEMKLTDLAAAIWDVLGRVVEKWRLDLLVFGGFLGPCTSAQPAWSSCVADLEMHEIVTGLNAILESGDTAYLARNAKLAVNLLPTRHSSCFGREGVVPAASIPMTRDVVNLAGNTVNLWEQRRGNAPGWPIVGCVGQALQESDAGVHARPIHPSFPHQHLGRPCRLVAVPGAQWQFGMTAMNIPGHEVSSGMRELYLLTPMTTT
ncbi:MAG: hypothetical protein NHG36_10960 [Chromatiaceae bacterium]|nr:hypothetical protein [Candidatus Thioaporhodococcus sediminis]